MRRCLLLIVSLLVFFTLVPLGAEQSTATPIIAQLTIDSAINPIVAKFISEQIIAANARKDRALLIELSTPGGLDSAMREIIRAELNSSIPIIVYVAPAGARAASAGTLITLAADFAAMAPGTNIGAAHPVSIGGGVQQDKTMEAKLVNDAAAYARSLALQRGRNLDWAEKAVRESISSSAQEALDQRVIDLIAADTGELQKKLNGRTYLRQGQKLTLTTTEAPLMKIEMNWRLQILSALSNPTFAYMLMMLGMLGIFFEIAQPGVILPGVVGTISILLAFFAFSTLPINYVGLLLILLAVVMFILEVKVPSYGMLTVGGIIAMAFGSLMLIDSSQPYLQISKAVIAATVGVSAGFILFASWMVIRTQSRPIAYGQEGMIGEHGRAESDIHDAGEVFVHGERWRARSDIEIKAGTEVEVVKLLDGLVLEVRATNDNPKVS
ncbi:NfeD family protein [Geopsychrobacter electrodiphilus]|uniref:NfeD family protein n=1 Tax=Geopsychrobacter electrodiphilus TaxID=225196 RepID=UPI0003649F6F|nr:nodulation protein NfeD [Geopsychrobacter electrodiphilus]